MQKIKQLYYKATAHVPRPMPTTKEELNKLKDIFRQAFGLEDNPQVWYTVFANIASKKATSTKISYGSLVNIAKRLDINKFLQDQKQLEYDAHMSTLEKKAKDALDEAKEQYVADPDEPLLPSGASDT